MILYGETVDLRPISVDDTDLILKWRNSDYVRNRFIYREMLTRDMHMDWLENKVKTGQAAQFIIIDKQGGKPVGCVYLRDIDKTHNKAEFGIYIGEESCCGKGLGSEASRLIIKYGFEVLNLHRIYLRVLGDNDRAVKSYIRTGFIREGCLKQDVFLDGEYKDVIIMGITKS